MDGTETLDGQRPIARTKEEGLRFARRMYLPRGLGVSVGMLAIGGGLWEAHAPLGVWLLLAANGLIWPHLAYQLARRARDPYRAERRNLICDSALGGAWIAAIGFNLVPSAVIVAMMTMDKAAVGGMRFLARCLNAQLVTAALATLANGFAMHLQSGMIAIVASMPLLIAYPVTIGYTAYRLARRVHQQNDMLSALSSIDGLTRLLNRTYWEKAVAVEFQRCRRIGHSSSLMMLDIDHFKTVNDSYGHLAGDDALRAVASILRESLRLQDLPGRYGGEEFGVVLPGADVRGAAVIAERIRKRIESAIVVPGRGVRVTVSIGFAAITPQDRDPAGWISRADRALYAAKAAGRNRAMGHEFGDGARTAA